MNVKEIQLSYPLQIHGAEVSVLKLRRPKVKDRLAVEMRGGSEVEKEIWFIAHLCEMTPDDIQELDLSDYYKVQEALDSFFG